MKTELEQQVARYFQSKAGRFSLNAEALTAERLLNWGGFGTPSLRVGDGERFVHVKLTADQRDLRRWLAVHERLEQEYRAPRVLAWVDIPGTPLGGLVFEHLAGGTWDPAARPELVHDAQRLLRRLHADRGLAEALGERPRSYRECWDLRYRDQYEQDLEVVRKRRPASVTDERVCWMEQESRTVLALAADPAFEGTTRALCHTDLWPNNILVESSGAWWVLDWDGLAVNDEAEDEATLVWPLVYQSNQDWRDWFPGEVSGSFAARMDLHLRAITLDYVIDVLADWAECDVPEWQEEVRRSKEAEHVACLDWYLSRWG